MQNEEKKRYASDLSNRIIPKFLDPNVEELLTPLSIQDLIIIHSNARWALETGAIPLDDAQKARFSEVVELVYDMILKAVKSTDILYVMFDKGTNLPYQNNEKSIYVFSDKEYAEECLDYYLQQYRMWEVRNIPKNEIISFLGQSFYMQGASSLVVDNGQTYINIAAEELIPPPDFSSTPHINIPVMNPEYMSALIQLRQEMTWRVTYPERGKILRQKEDAMIKAFCEARFLVPVKGLEDLASTSSQGTVTLKEDRKFSIPTLSSGESSFATPVYTDWAQFNKSFSQDEWGGWIWSAEDLVSAPEETVVVNSGTICFPMSRKMIKQMLDIYKNELMGSPDK